MRSLAQHCLAAVAAFVLAVLCSAQNNAFAQANVPIYIVIPGQQLGSFQSNNPNAFSTSNAVSITGLQSNEQIVGIDFRPATGQLYALAVIPQGRIARLVIINPQTGATTPIGNSTFTLEGSSIFSTGFDFNPTVDRIRVVTDTGRNYRLNPDTGAVAFIDTNLAYASGDRNEGQTPNVEAAAYLNNFNGATFTILYDIDVRQNVLVRQVPPNEGTLNTVGALGIDPLAGAQFDIAAGDSTAYATMTTANDASASRLYTINLTSGAATDRGQIGSSAVQVQAMTVAPTGPGSILISEFRSRGPSGANDEFVELYNNTDVPIDVNGFTVASIVSGSTQALTIPGSAVLQPRSHFLGTNKNSGGYSLDAYAVGDAQYVSFFTNFTLDDNTGIALFNNAGVRIDAVGFTSVTDPIFREGSGLQPSGGIRTNAQHSFVRRLENGFPQDTNNNANDFVLVATDPFAVGNGATLGAPGPQNRSSPVQRNREIKSSLLDGSRLSSESPNRVRNATPVGNGISGTLSIQRRFTNTTGRAVTRLRFRIIGITTLGSANRCNGCPQADLRVLSSTGTVTDSSGNTVATVQGLTLEEPPAQSNSLGGGLNSTLTVIPPNGSLAAGSSIDVQFRLGVQENGIFRFLVNVEALTNPPSSPSSPDELSPQRKRANAKDGLSRR